MQVPEVAGLAHLPVMAAIHAAAFPPAEAWGVDALGIQLGLPGVAGWVDQRGGMILVRRAADELEVLTLAVLPTARRLGVATSLLDRALRWAAAEGVGSVFLEVAEDNAAALALYRRFDFGPVGLRRRYYPGGRDALILRRQLTRPAAAEAR